MVAVVESDSASTDRRPLWAALSVILIAAAFGGDIITGSEIDFAPLYLIGIGVATWFVGFVPALAVSGLALAAWAFASELVAQHHSHPFVLVWNLTVEMIVFVTVAIALQRLRAASVRQREMLTEVERAHAGLDAELRSVGALQRSLLPRALDAPPGYSLAVRYRTATRAGGDYYDVLRIDGRLALLVSDASGHGTAAAVVMAMLRVLVLAEPRLLLRPADALAALNARLVRAIPEGRFVTACCATLDPDTGRLDYALAGHPPPLRARSDGTIDRLEVGDGLPLGAFDGAAFSAGVASLRPGDQVLFYTDGLIESFDSNGSMLGIEGIEPVLGSNACRPGEEVLEQVMATFERHQGGRPLADDMTVLLLKAEPA
jgi:sigma-B regulation protein RsbU (phosphoserine phosphatase)